MRSVVHSFADQILVEPIFCIQQRNFGQVKKPTRRQSDLHAGQVKQIVGGTLLDTDAAALQTNHVSAHPAQYYARLYRQNNLRGGHVIMLGPGNEDAAQEALSQWPQGLQVGGGVTDKNAKDWIDRGAEKVIVTSFLFPEGRFSEERLQKCVDALGDQRLLVIDLSCRRKDNTWFVATNKWQTITNFEITPENVRLLEPYCSEFLIHAADNEGLQRGIDSALVQHLAQCCTIPVTYAGGARHLEDLEHVRALSNGRIDVTVGSALDVFGGTGVKFEDCVAWNQQASS